MKRFNGTNVLVTGASRGIGAEIARAFAREGARVWIGFRVRQQEADAVVESIKKEGGEASALGFDLRRAEDVERAFGLCGPLDILVNNAAVSRDNFFALLDEEAWSDVLETNLGGTMRCSRAAVRLMWSARKGVIINIASVSGPVASPGQSSYAASKGGVIALTKTLARELAPRGIRVNAVVPGLIDEGMTTRLDRRILKDKQDRIPTGRLGKAEDVAAAVLFLASSEASYIIGQALFVDGGLTL
jgi:3-oxoacyl-[acyl-carrier protein] reductase